jgi:CHAT domain-containing protein/tetratricopeptide (TPR) repeat protein
LRRSLVLAGAWLAVIGLYLAGCRGTDTTSRRHAADEIRTLLLTGQYDDAERAAWSHFEATRETPDAIEVAELRNLLVRALVANGKAASPATATMAEEFLRDLEQRRQNPRGLADALINLSSVLTAAGDRRQAVAALERAVAVVEGIVPPDPMALAETLDHLGKALANLGGIDEALAELRRSLRLKEEGHSGPRVGIARTLEAIGSTLHRQGNYAEARPLIERAARIREEAGADHPEYVDYLNLLHQQLWFEGRFSESRRTAARSVELAERLLRADHPTLARALRYLAAAEWSLGDMRRAYSLWERAYGIASRNFGENHHETAMYLHDVALADLHIGEYSTSRTRFARALELFEAKYGQSHDFVATALHNLALVDARLGDYSIAQQEQARATAIWESTGGAGHPFVALGLIELATVLRERGATAAAVALLERALTIQQERLGREHPDVARTLSDLATSYLQAGDVGRAHELSSHAVRIWEHQDTPEAPDFASVLTLYADLQMDRGRIAEARVSYERALRIREKVFGRSHPSVAEAEAGLALSMSRSGQRQEALRIAARAEATGLDHLRLMLRHLPERQSLNYASSRPRGLDIMLSMTPAESGSVAEAFGATIRGRAVVLDEMSARHRAGLVGGKDASLLETLVSARQRLANLLVLGPVELTPRQYAGLVDDARRESDLAEQRLAQQSAEFRTNVRKAHLGLQDVTAALPDGSALVAFVRYHRLPLEHRSEDTVSTRREGIASYLAFVLRSDQSPAVVQLGEATGIERLVGLWRAGLTETAAAGGTKASAAPPRASGVALRSRIWDPLASHLRNARRIFIVSDGVLGLLPFAALPIGESSYLLERAPPVHYLTAERDLVVPPGEPTTVPRGLLALGGPAFDDVSFRAGATPTLDVRLKPPADGSALRRAALACRGIQSLHFEPLEGTLEEVQELSGVWTGRSVGESARVLVGPQATETAFKAGAHGYRVLHLATHGFFLNTACATPSASGTRGVGGLAGAQSAPVENPLLLSGLAFAGANRRASAGPDQDDGILTAEEVASLDLSGVEWAVLSACDTGVGEVRAGEGVFGLRRAFQVAGARTVIMSLWSVDDQATRAWMRALYEGRFQQRLSTADAVHAASLAVLKDRRAKGLSTHPFYWAAFVAAGDWR